MPTLPKNAMPSLVNIACKAIIKTCSFLLLFQVSRQNKAFKKQLTSFNSFGPLKKTISQTLANNSLVVPSDRKEVRILTSFPASNMQQIQKFNVYNGFEMCIIVILVRIGVFVQAFTLKQLQKPNAQSKRTTEILGTISLSIEDPFLKRLESFLVEPIIFNSFFLQIPNRTNKLLKYSKDARKLTEISIFPETLDNNKKLCNSNDVDKKSLMKTAQICFACKESIKKKPFFDERRFGILERCDCMFCYGCIRKASGISDGVVKEPVNCPTCSVKSDTVASARLWIEGEEKVKYFETFSKNLQNVGKKPNLKWPTPSIGKDEWIREPKTVNFATTLSDDKKPNLKWTNPTTGKDEWIREPTMVNFATILSDDLQSDDKKPNLKWTNPTIGKDEEWNREPKTVNFAETFRMNFPETYSPESAGIRLHSRKYDIWTRGLSMVLVN